MKHIGYVIRMLRKRRKLTLDELAAAAGTDAGNLSRMELGKQEIPDDKLLTLAKLFGTKISGLYQIAESHDEDDPELCKKQANLLQTISDLGVLPGDEAQALMRYIHERAKSERTNRSSGKKLLSGSVERPLGALGLDGHSDNTQET